MDENNNYQQPQNQDPVYQQPEPQQQYQQPYGQPPYVQGYPFYPRNDESGFFSENKLARQNGLSARVKLGDWMKIDCIGLLSLIPIIGSIAVIVIYCIMAFSSKTAVSVRSRLIANLIWAGISLVISIILFSVFAALFASIASYSKNWWY